MEKNNLYLDSDGTLGISADVDISKVKRILLTQEGTHYGLMYSQNLPDTNVGDTIYRQSAIDIVRNRVKRYTTACVLAVTELQQLPSTQPDNRLSKIAELMEGTIDHFDLDDAMDLLYQIKDVLKDE